MFTRQQSDDWVQYRASVIQLCAHPSDDQYRYRKRREEEKKERERERERKNNVR